MKLGLYLVLSLICGAAAFGSGDYAPNALSNSRTEATCNFNDCAHWGWTLRAWSGPAQADVECVEGDCFTLGWLMTDNYGNRQEVQCLSPGCFLGGWNSISWPVHGPVTQNGVRCNDGDCWHKGWTGSGAGGMIQTYCNNGDCAKSGWVTQGNYFQSLVVCKLNDCFRYGWKTDASY